MYEMTSDVCVDLWKLGVLDDCGSEDLQIGWVVRRFTSILGVKFTGGDPLEGIKLTNWKTRRCGYVFTTHGGCRWDQ